MKAYQWLLGFLIAGIVAIAGCSPDTPDSLSTPVLSKPIPAKVYSYEYLCELGYPGYESYCEDFGSLAGDPCHDAAANGNWAYLSLHDCFQLGTALDTISSSLLNQARSWIYTHELQALGGLQSSCDELANTAAASIDENRLRTTLGYTTDLGASIYYSTIGGTKYAAVINRSEVDYGIASLATTVIHEAAHLVFNYAGIGLDGQNLGNDASNDDGGTRTVAAALSSRTNQCFSGLTY